MKKLILIALLISSNLQALPTIVVDGTLTWTPPTKMLDGTTIAGALTYTIYCASGIGGYSKVIDLTESQIPLKDLSLTGPQTCAVTAKVDSMESAFSNTVTFTCNEKCLSGNGPVAPVIKIE